MKQLNEISNEGTSIPINALNLKKVPGIGNPSHNATTMEGSMNWIKHVVQIYMPPVWIGKSFHTICLQGKGDVQPTSVEQELLTEASESEDELFAIEEVWQS